MRIKSRKAYLLGIAAAIFVLVSAFIALLFGSIASMRNDSVANMDSFYRRNLFRTADAIILVSEKTDFTETRSFSIGDNYTTNDGRMIPLLTVTLISSDLAAEKHFNAEFVYNNGRVGELTWQVTEDGVKNVTLVLDEIEYEEYRVHAEGGIYG